MSRTEAEKREFDQQCYGMAEETLQRIVRDALSGPSMLAMGMLSDAQHLIDPDHGINDVETARQYINRAKYILSVYWDDSGIAHELRRERKEARNG